MGRNGDGKQMDEEQKQAIDARGSDLLIAAAAGSGKTAVLVELHYHEAFAGGTGNR